MEGTLKSWAVYRHISPSGKVYIGITSLRPKDRWGLGGNKYQKGTYFRNAILKYGWDNIKHEILFEHLTEDRAKRLEINLISHYKRLGISYNISAGGDGNSCPCSNSTKAKLSKALKVHKSYERDQKWRDAASQRAKLQNNFTPEIRQKALANSLRTNSKAVAQYSLEGELIQIHNSISSAARLINGDASYIVKCCKGIKDSAYGYIWKYKI